MMRSKLFLIGILVMLGIHDAQSAQLKETVIQVKPVIEVDGSRAEISLGDLVVGKGLSREIRKILRNVRLADTPNPGESRSFTFMGLNQIFTPHLKEIEARTGQNVSLRLPSRVTILRKSFRLNPEDIEAEIRAELQKLCAECEFEISSLSVPAVGRSITAGSTWRLRMRPQIPRGGFSIPLEVSHEDGSRRTFWVSGQIVVRRVVPVAARTLMIGERLGPQDFMMQLQDVTFTNDGPAAAEDFSSSVIARQVAAGQVIWRSQLRREMAVKHGDAVRVTAGSDEWQIAIEGIAQSSGYIGDLVRVKIPRTQKMVSGLLKEKGIVEVR